MYDGLYPMLSQNLHACRVNKMLKFDFDDEDIMAITYSTWPWSDQHVKQMVFDLDIFQLPTTTKQLLIMVPPDSYTETKKGLKLLDGMTLSQKGKRMQRCHYSAFGSEIPQYLCAPTNHTSIENIG
jgi:hypothetical protein